MSFQLDKLSFEHIEKYECQGYLVLKDFIPQPTIDLLKRKAYVLASKIREGTQPFIAMHHKTLWSFKDLQETTQKLCCTFEDLSSLSNLFKISHALHKIDPIYHSFTYSSEINMLLNSLGLASPQIIQSQLHFKPPHSQSAVDWHQDATYIMTNPSSTTGLWVALEEATPQNSCLKVIPGGHKQKLTCRMIRKSSGEVIFKKFYQHRWKEEKAVELPASPGTLIILHGLLPHMSAANKSEFSRLSLTLHYCDKETEYSKENWLRYDLL